MECSIITELLKILLSNIDKITMIEGDPKGLGVLIDKLNRSRIINNFENHKLLNYIYINNQVNNYVPYFWERGMKEPRIQWLKEQIEKLENENKN